MKKHFKGISLPVLVAIFPIIFLYSYNSKVLQPDNIVVPLFVSMVAAVAAYGLFFLFQRRSVIASLSTAVFMVFFCSYGVLYQFLLKGNRFPVEHITLLPIVITIACYLGYFVSFVRSKTATLAQNILLVIGLGLVGFNVISAVPAEIQKIQLQKAANQKVKPVTNTTSSQKSPDIYYIMLDEYAGLDAIRNYWHENYVDEFEAFLKENNFFVSNNSHSTTISTLVEMSSRLNLKYPVNTDRLVLFQEIADNEILRLVKKYGYTTVVISKTFPPFNADYNFTYLDTGLEGLGADEYKQLLLDNSMLSAFANIFQNNDAGIINRRDTITYSLNKTADLGEIESPKFVFTYLPYPHMPFIIDKNGRLIDQKYNSNWEYYLGQHQYATKQIMDLVTKLLKNADPQNLPVIIIQSDHGARNVQLASADSVTLKNYPDEYKTLILNALYLPGYNYANLSDDFQPIYTFELVLNYYLNASVKVDQGASPEGSPGEQSSP